MNDQLIALIRTVWQSIIASVLAYLVSLGINIDATQAFAVTWPIVMAIYYAAAQAISRVAPAGITRALMGPASAPTYTD